MFLGRARQEGIFLRILWDFHAREKRKESENNREKRKEGRGRKGGELSWASGSVEDQETPASTTAISHLSGDI